MERSSSSAFVRGLLRGRSIELESSLDVLDGEVEVTVRRARETTTTAAQMAAYLTTLPIGTRNKTDIDLQLAADRDEWR
jgi:hypothetical protein